MIFWLTDYSCRVVHTKFNNMDANFSLINLKKNCDPDDISLWNGRGYFVEEGPFLQYVDDHAGDKEEVSRLAFSLVVF